MLRQFVVDREITHVHGRGVYAYYITREAFLRHGAFPFLLTGPIEEATQLDPLDRKLLEPVFRKSLELRQIMAKAGDRRIHFDMPMICSLSNDLVPDELSERVEPRSRFGLTFFHNARFGRDAIDRAKRYHTIIAGSTWNLEVLKANGIENVALVHQGTEPSLFHPAPRSGLFGDRFVVFSGGKLEYRKGQDIVLAAFRAFRQRHEDALLLTAWDNLWPQFVYGLSLAGHATTEPVSPDGKRLEISRWIMENGIPEDAFVNIGLIPHTQTPAILREADAAVFPNRAEGGTNMVALECMACGVPVILSANTGHLDLADETMVYPLRDQKPAAKPNDYTEVEGWGESSVEELLEALEAVYADREAACRRGAAASSFMHARPWSRQVRQMLDILGHG